ncbi:MAG: PQQ-binding-like beta-propeller repeat protein [Actinomycetota bacterium]
MAGSLDLDIEELRDYETIGQGGFSTVLSAWDVGFQRRVAVKVIPSLDDAGLRRFERERAIMGRLSYHPNVIMPFRAGFTKNGAAYLVMELGDGGSLEELFLQRGPIPWREAVGYVLAATAALDHAHSRGIIHRDVKPANILLAGDVPKLTDFGIAALKETTASVMAYTLNHCPPEAFAHGTDTRDERSDLYSMASSLFTMLTGGDAPYDVEGSDSQQAYMFRIISDEVPQLPADLDVPDALRTFVHNALAKDPDERPRTAETFMADLRAILDDPTAAQARLADRSSPHGGSGPTKVSTTAPTVVAPSSDSASTSPVSGGSTPSPTDGGSGTHSKPTVVSGEGPAIVDPAAVDGSGAGGAQGSTGPGLDFPPPSTDPVEVVEPTSTGEAVAPSVAPPSSGRRGRWLLAVAALVVALAGAAGAAVVLAGDGGTEGDGDEVAVDTGDEVTTDEVEPEPEVEPEVEEEVEDGAPTPVWEFETESSLASKPAVADGTLVIGAQVTNTVHAIDTETGEERWAFATGDGVEANPVIVDGVVYVGANDGMFHAIDLTDGTEVWSADLGGAIKGTAFVRDDTVYVGTSEPAFQALDLATGQLRWTSPIPPNEAFTVEFNSRPVAVTYDGAEVVAAGANDGGLYLYDPATGDEVDRIQLDGGVWFSGPLVLDTDDGGEELWVGTSVEQGGSLSRVTFPEGEVRAFSSSRGVGTDPALTSEGYIVFGNDDGEVFAVDRTTLGEIWRQGYAVDTQIKGSPVVVGDRIIFGTHDKELIAVSSEDGTEIWRFEGERIFGLSAPVVVDDQLFVGNDSGTVYRFDL